jgi:hypothetical protein
VRAPSAPRPERGPTYHPTLDLVGACCHTIQVFKRNRSETKHMQLIDALRLTYNLSLTGPHFDAAHSPFDFIERALLAFRGLGLHIVGKRVGAIAKIVRAIIGAIAVNL